jgi:phage recombination protein Bet
MSAEPTQLITAAESRAAEQERKSLLATFADKYGLEPKTMMATLKATAFKGDVTNEQMAALLIVAHQHNLNPWCKEIYAFPSRQGIVPIVGVDGWAPIINEHPQFDGMDFEQDDEKCTCRMYRKDRSHPIAVTEYAAECKRPTDPWTTHPKRMLRHKTMIQAARLAFSFAGIYDPDEGERVLAAEDAIDVTPSKPTLQLDEDGKPEFVNEDGSPHVPPKKVSPTKLREAVEGARDAVKAEDAVALYEVRSKFDNEQWLFIWGTLRSYEKTGITKLQGSNAYKIAESGLDLPAWAVTALGNAKDLEALDKTYAIVEEMYAEHDQEVPLDIQTCRTDRKAELGA